MRLTSSVATLVVIFALIGCNKSNSGVPSTPTPVPQAAGGYSGTVTDSAMGSGTATLTLSQSGSSIGGTLVETFPTTTLNNTFALVTDVSGNLSGNGVATVNNVACGFTVAGTYNTTTGQLTGTYTAFSGCTGQSGTMTLLQQCTNPYTALRFRRDHAVGVLPC